MGIAAIAAAPTGIAAAGAGPLVGTQAIALDRS